MGFNPLKIVTKPAKAILGAIGLGSPKTGELPGYTPPTLDRSGIDKLKTDLAALPAFKPLQAEAVPTELSKASLPQFDLLREQTDNRLRAGQQEGMDALKRRFAAIGGLSGGASIKAEQNLITKNQQAREDALQGIGFQEAQEKQRQFDQERQGAIQRNFSRETANADRAFQDMVYRFDSKSKLAQLDLAAQDSDMQRKQAAYESELNKYQMQHSGGLLGGGGLLGTGINL